MDNPKRFPQVLVPYSTQKTNPPAFAAAATYRQHRPPYAAALFCAALVTLACSACQTPHSAVANQAQQDAVARPEAHATPAAADPAHRAIPFSPTQQGSKDQPAADRAKAHADHHLTKRTAFLESGVTRSLRDQASPVAPAAHTTAANSAAAAEAAAASTPGTADGVVERSAVATAGHETAPQPAAHDAPLLSGLPRAAKHYPTMRGQVPRPKETQWTRTVPVGLPAEPDPGPYLGPGPRDEYLFDGGDRRAKVVVRPNWDVLGLDMEDTVAHYDTLDGRTVVKPSNRVKIYSPRFASVRKVTEPVAFIERQRPARTEQPIGLGREDELLLVASVMQPLQPKRHHRLDRFDLFREQTRGVPVDAVQKLIHYQGDLKPYADFAIIRRGEFDQAEKPRLALSLAAALQWTHTLGVEVLIGDVRAHTATSDAKPQSTYTYELPPGKPKLRIVKLASKHAAQPGDEVEFTLRFDNLGNEPIGNVTILDNLTTRLEYIPETQTCSLKANFMTQENEGDSLILRWEIVEPMEVGDGGIIRFRCRVR